MTMAAVTSAAKRCPHCGLFNPASAERCDCGFNFLTGIIDKRQPAISSPGTTATRPSASWYQFAGSTTALVFGWLTFASGANALAPGAVAEGRDASGLVIGPAIVLGALAYRSLKRTHLGLRRPSAGRRFGEIVALVGVVLMVIMQRDVLTRMYEQPFQNVFIPLWVLAAYAALFTRPPKS
jgi:hypothetical protein